MKKPNALFYTLALLCLTSFARADLVILQYHHISSTTPRATSTTLEEFMAHLDLIEAQQMTVVDLPTAIADLQANKDLAARAIAITFDDAYLSIYESAFPLLKQKHWPFTIFVNPVAVDRNYPGTISWEQLREMQAAGGTIANHSMNHPYLLQRPAELSLDQWLQQEIGVAQQRLQAEMGNTPRLFAYPYGEYDPAMAAWLEQQGYLAFGQQSGAVGHSTDWQLIPRYPAGGYYADIPGIREKLRTLPFKQTHYQRQSPVLANASIPPLVLSLVIDDWRPSRLTCYASGEGRIPVAISSQTDSEVTIQMQASQPMRGGRSRYNCTAPSISKPGYFYWISQLWINSQVQNR